MSSTVLSPVLSPVLCRVFSSLFLSLFFTLINSFTSCQQNLSRATYARLCTSVALQMCRRIRTKRYAGTLFIYKYLLPCCLRSASPVLSLPIPLLVFLSLYLPLLFLPTSLPASLPVSLFTVRKLNTNFILGLFCTGATGSMLFDDTDASGPTFMSNFH